MQKFILKLVFFLLIHHVPDMLIIYIYMLSLALIILLSLLLYVKNSYKKAFWVEIIFSLVQREGLISQEGETTELNSSCSDL